MDAELLGRLFLVGPEITLFMTAILVLVADIAWSGKTGDKVVTTIATVGFVMALGLTVITFSFGDPTSVELFSRSLLIDRVSQFFKALLILSGMITAILGWMSREVRSGERAELHVLVILGTLAMCVLASAVHFLVIFMAYEMVGIACCVLAAFKRRSGLSSEAGMKLFVHGALSSILFAFGIVMVYGIAKSFNVLDIRGQLATVTVNMGYLWIAFGLIFVAVAQRLAMFPFQSITPDVMQGAPTPVSAFFSVSVHIATAAFALRLCLHLFSAKAEGGWVHLAGFEWPELLTGVAAATMTIGNLTALFQTNLKRLVGYSCIGQVGYLMMGLAVSNHTGIAATLFSLAAYGIVTLGAIFVIQLVTDSAKSEDISILKGLVWRNPFEAVALCLFLLSLAGLPPLVGFVGRFYVLGVVIKAKIYWLAIVAAVNWVIGLTYYLSMVRQVFAPNPRDQSGLKLITHPVAQVALGVLVLPAVALGVYWDPLMLYISRSLELVVW